MRVFVLFFCRDAGRLRKKGNKGGGEGGLGPRGKKRDRPVEPKMTQEDGRGSKNLKSKVPRVMLTGISQPTSTTTPRLDWLRPGSFSLLCERGNQEADTTLPSPPPPPPPLHTRPPPSPPPPPFLLWCCCFCCFFFLVLCFCGVFFERSLRGHPARRCVSAPTSGLALSVPK